MPKSLSAFVSFLFLLLALSLGGCGVHYVSGTISPNFQEYSIKKVAVLPFRTQTDFLEGKNSVIPQTSNFDPLQRDENGFFKCLVCPDHRAVATTPVEEGSARLLTQIFTERLRETGKFQLIPQEQVEAAVEALKKAADDGSEAITTNFAQRIGTTLGADAVITGEVQAFTERKGGPRAVERPATVGFVAQMMNVKDGRLLWSSDYYETQKNLSEDLNTLPLFLKRRGRWLTAQELAEYGVNEMIKTLPKPKG